MTKNILFITTDQHHYTAMGYLNPEVQTPNLDRLVSKGITFNRAYTPNPTCTSTRASWITGMYPSQHGAYSLGTKLMESVPTVGDSFKEAGYKTALVGKAHFQPLMETEEYSSLEAYPHLHDLDFWRNFHGPFYGFDHIELARNHTDESHAGQHYALWMEDKGFKSWRDHFLPNCPSQTVKGDLLTESIYAPGKSGEAWCIPEEYHYNNWITERTNALMEEYSSHKKPFFLWASYFDPHPAYKVPEPYASMYDPKEVSVPEMVPGELDDKPPYFKKSQEINPDFSDFREAGGNDIHGAGSHLKSKEERARNIATMYGMVTMLDIYIGKLLDNLKFLGIEEETMVCFTSDHGDFLGHHGLTKKAIHHYEDLLRVPLIISQPGTIPENIRSEVLQSTVDLAPSFLGMTGLPVPQTMTGLDISAFWRGETDPIRDHVIVENRHQPTKMYMQTFIEQRYKITIHFNQEYGELYDLENDSGEIINLWDKSEYQEIKSKLLLRFLYGEMGKSALLMPRIAGA